MEIVAATCNDGVRNGGEIGIDCDGPCVKRCYGRACSLPDHCWSGVCGTNRTCLAATCNDGVRNGGEIGIDCDGPCVKQCNGRACSLPDHCWSGVCGTNRTCLGK
ncbi:unnamed protein product [Rotaria sp. Silwood1]|nr:unnamed protein product [Rotaria sp. Silwood1]CAF5130765.1 unnamed protein product [Rotaria sp. Silwood1]